MASIDINKLIQESMTTVMTKPVDDTDDTNVADGIDVDNIHENMKSVINELSMADVKNAATGVGDSISKGAKSAFKFAKKTATDAGDSVSKGAKKAYNTAADSVSGTGSSVSKAVKKAAGATKDLIQDHPIASSAAAAGAAGLVGAGVMAKKYLARKKAGK